jgi:hypothetical protein
MFVLKTTPWEEGTIFGLKISVTGSQKNKKSIPAYSAGLINSPKFPGFSIHSANRTNDKFLSFLPVLHKYPKN